MHMDGEIRVRTDERHGDIYKDLRNFAFGDMHEIFLLCVILGYKANRKKPLGKSGEDRFRSHTITPEEWSCYYAVMLEPRQMDFNSIQNDKDVIGEMEEYANAGMEILLEDVLQDFLVRAEKIPRLERGSSPELPKVILGFIYEKNRDGLNRETRDV